MRRLSLLAVLALALAGCGGGSHGHAQTVGAYGSFAATTVAALPGGPANCRKDGEIFARDAKRFVAHSTTSASYPADLYYVILRDDFADFEARECAPSYLHDPLVQRLNASERRVLVANLPAAMAATVRAGL